MLKVAVKGLATRRLRAVLTALAIVLGVALVAGTYVLTDSLHSDLGNVYQTIYKNTAASITGRNAIDTGANAANGGDVDRVQLAGLGEQPLRGRKREAGQRRPAK